MPVIAAVLVLLPVHGIAQTGHEFKEGEKLRIRTDGESGRYVLDRFSPDTLYVQGEKDEQFRRIALGEIEKLEIRVPRSKGTGALIGAGIGGAIGATIGMIYGLATWDDVEADCGDPWDVCSNTASSARVIGIIGAIGIPCMAAGALIGAAAPGQTWRQVELGGSLSMHVERGRELRVQYSRSF
jgi:hypothetical protein